MHWLLLVSLMWGFSFGLIRTRLAGVDAAFVSGARLLLSLAVFLPWVRVRGRRPAWILSLVGVGAVQYGVMYLTYIRAFHYLEAYQVALMTIFTPLYVAWVHDVAAGRWHRRYFITALLAVAGTAVIHYRRIGLEDFGMGFLLMQVSNLCFAAGQVVYRNLMRSAPGESDRTVFAWLYLGGVAVTVPLAWRSAPAVWGSLDPGQWGVLLYLGLLPSGLGFFLWNVGARRVNAGALAIANNLKIPIAVAAALLWFGERAPPARLVLGGVLLGGALVLNEAWEKRSRLERRAGPREGIPAP